MLLLNPDGQDWNGWPGWFGAYPGYPSNILEILIQIGEPPGMGLGHFALPLKEKRSPRIIPPLP